MTTNRTFEAFEGPLATGIEEYRDELRAYVHNNPELARWREETPRTAEGILAAHAELLAVLYRDGWNRYGWPASVSGWGGSERHRAVLYDELTMSGLPIPEQCTTLETLGPAMIRFAPALASRYLPAYLSGQEWWGQGFSEPEAGSDLAALRTRGVFDKDALVVTGQKIWTSHGGTAKRLVCLVRTGSAELRHRSLTTVLIDADAPGVTIRPIALASGQRDLAEVFLDDVRIPADRIIGTVDGGWAVAMYLMQWERAMYCYAAMARLLLALQQLRDRMVSAGVTGHAETRHFAATYVQVSAAKARCLVSLTNLADRKSLGPESSIDKLLCAEAEQSAYDLVAEVLGHATLVALPEDDDYSHGWNSEWWFSRAATIMGGSAEIQRGIIADLVLALPKD